MKKLAFIFIAVALFAGLRLPGAKAQDLGGVFNLPMLGQSLTLGATMRAHSQRDARRLRGRSTRSHKTRRATAKGSTRFRTNFAVRQRNLAQFVSSVRKVDPQGAAGLQQNFAKGDPIAAIAPGLKRFKLRTDDVADAATVYLISAWYGVRGRNDDPPQTYVNGVREQMRDVMLSVPTFATASDAIKQQMAEAMFIQTMAIDGAITSSKGKAAQMAKAKIAIGQGARSSFQLDMTKLKLTNRGFQM